MHALTATKLLDAWERGLSQSPTQRGLTLLALASADTTPERLAELSIGQRDARLLALRERVFGPHMTGHVSCPVCDQQLELHFTVAEICVNSPAELTKPDTFTQAGYEVSFRLPDSLDLATLVPDGDTAANRRCLLHRCVLTARHNGQETPADQLPAEVASAISEQMAKTDPQADVQLVLTCPLCGHRWQSPLDIMSFLWTEIDAWASRLLREVHVLALAYGWRENDILGLSPWRRQAYLEMIDR